MKNGDRPALPFNSIEHGYQPSFGLTKREYFAGLAMQGLLAHTGGQSVYANTTIVGEAIDFADALLEELEKTEK